MVFGELMRRTTAAANRQNPTERSCKTYHGCEVAACRMLGFRHRLYPASQHDLENFLHCQFENWLPVLLVGPRG
jgi:hypothetical protein